MLNSLTVRLLNQIHNPLQLGWVGEPDFRVASSVVTDFGNVANEMVGVFQLSRWDIQPDLKEF